MRQRSAYCIYGQVKEQMNLILTVIDDPAGSNMVKHTKAFKQTGGSFGRGESNDWVLPDKERFLSTCHATIEYAKEEYLLKDVSTNGTFINNQEQPLGTNDLYSLQDGDIIRAGEYRLKVSIRQPVSNNNQAIPEGLGDADFLDHPNHTTVESPDIKAQANDLDSWINDAPPAPSAKQGWGNVAPDYNSLSTDPMSAFEATPQKPRSSNISDPLAALSQTPSTLAAPNNVTPAPRTPSEFSIPSVQSISSDVKNTQKESNDPLSALEQLGNKAPVSNSAWNDDEDWWKDGSQADHSPADKHFMQPRAELEQTNIQTTSPAHDTEKTNTPEQTAERQHKPDRALDVFSQRATSDSIESISTSNSRPDFRYHPKQVQQVSPTQAPQHHSTESQKYPTAQVLAELLGLEKQNDDQLNQLLPEAAEIISETINRLIDLLRARSRLKNELRTDRTMIGVIDNNPLKFSATPTDALRTMFSANSSAFLSPKETINSSFNDLSDHQVAVLSGMRAAYESMLEHFSPSNLENFINTPQGVFSSKNAKRWQGYQEYYKALLRDQETTYNTLFGDEFAQIYEQQLSELENARTLTNKN